MNIRQKKGFPDVVLQKISYDEFRLRTNHPSYWINLTPHPINLIVSEMEPKSIYDVHRVLCVEFPVSGNVARVEFGEPDVSIIDGFRVHENVPINGVVFLPESRDNINLIVSALVREQLRGQGRTDVFSPDTGSTALRNDKGAVFAVRALQRA